jgi:hypothetical protein
MTTRTRAVITFGCVVALGFAGCGGGASDARPSPSPPGASGEPMASSGRLEACITRQGGHGTRVKRPSEGFAEIQTAHAFDVVHADGTSLSVAVEATPEAAQRLETETEGVLVGIELANQSVSEEAPAEMRDAAAETVHRVNNVVILYSNPRHDEDSGIARCLERAR